MKQPVKVLFASGSGDLIPTAIEHMLDLLPELPLIVVSEFPPPDQTPWIPYHLQRSFGENLSLCRASLRGKKVRLAAVILQPRMPYWRMRATALALAPLNFLAFNENFGHFMLRPQSVWTMLRHFLWRSRNFFVWEFSPGGAIYTFLWRLIHPWAFRRLLLVGLAQWAGWLVALRKTSAVKSSHAERTSACATDGLSVVIPSRNGRDLLARGLPEVVRQIEAIGGEVIVSDNGSTDGTAEWLKAEFTSVRRIASEQPLSFARAVNAGIDKARFTHTCLLNNDMVIEAGFFIALRAAFERVPDLFCATAQIFFPQGQRREETGIAVMRPAALRKPADFPVTCLAPVEGQDLSYVLYGSGGCSLFDTAKLLSLGGLDNIYEPAYVEDLDLGVRGWHRGWPTVFVAGACVLHEHRTTTSRYYTPEQLETILELNYLRFLAHTISKPEVFRQLWRNAIGRLNLLAARQEPNRAALAALSEAWRAPAWISPARSLLPEQDILALGSGAVAVFPGRPPRAKPVIVIASPYLPFPLAHGGAVRIYNLMRRAAADFDQVLISFTSGLNPAPSELLDICVEIVTIERYGSHFRRSSQRPDVVEEFDSPAYRAALHQTIRKWRPFGVQLEFTQMAQYAADCAPAKALLIEHDVTLDLYQQLLAQGEDWELRYQLERWVPFETAAWREVDCVVTMSEKDRTLVQGRRVIALPNGVDLDRFRPCQEAPETGRLLFIGSFGHLPNLLAIEYFLRDVWPRLEGVRLHIIAGARHQYFLDHYRDRVRVDLNLPGIEVEDFVSDVRPAYRRASIVIAPLLASAGTNIKILEAMAMGKAIVSTPGGVNGLDLEPGRDIVVTSTSEAMATGIQELNRDGEKRRRLETQARQTVEDRFNWDVIAERQKELYESLLDFRR